MADRETTFRLRFENEDMEKVFDGLLKRVEYTNKSFEELGKNQQETFEKLNQQLEKLNENLQQEGKNLDKNKVKFGKLGDQAQDALESVSEKGGEATSAIARLGRRGGIVGTILAAAGTLIAASFLDVKENAKAARIEMEGIKAVGNELKTRTFAAIRGLSKAAFGAFSGNAKVFANSANDFALAMGEGRDSLSETAEKGRDFARTQDRINKNARELIKIETQRAVELRETQALLADESKTTKEKIELLRTAEAVEKEISNLTVARLENELFLIQEERRLYGERANDQELIAQIESELIEARSENQLIAIQTQQEINALLKEEAEAREKIIEQIKDTSALINNQESERAIEKQISAFEELRNSINAAGLASQYREELEDLNLVIDGLKQRLEEGLVQPLEELPTLMAGAVESNVEDFEIIGGIVTEKINEGFFDKLKNISDEQRDFIESQLQDAFSSVADIVVQSTLTQIDRQEAVVDAREDNISELERQLAEQEKLEAQGLANQSSRLRQNLQQEREILKREQDRRIELEKKAARQRLIANSLQQGSEITLASAKLLNQGASGFIPGLIAAAGGIALLFRIIAQARANAAAFATPPKFREGTSYLVGPSHEAGGVTIEAEGGERILSRALNEELGGRKMTNEELVEFALMGMNAEQGIAPMAAAIASGASARRKEQEYNAWERNEVLAQVFREEIQALKQEMKQTIKERPTYYPTEQAGRREYYKDNMKVVEKIIPNK